MWPVEYVFCLARNDNHCNISNSGRLKSELYSVFWFRFGIFTLFWAVPRYEGSDWDVRKDRDKKVEGITDVPSSSQPYTLVWNDTNPVCHMTARIIMTFKIENKRGSTVNRRILVCHTKQYTYWILSRVWSFPTDNTCGNDLPTLSRTKHMCSVTKCCSEIDLVDNTRTDPANCFACCCWNYFLSAVLQNKLGIEFSLIQVEPFFRCLPTVTIWTLPTFIFADERKILHNCRRRTGERARPRWDSTTCKLYGFMVIRE